MTSISGGIRSGGMSSTELIRKLQKSLTNPTERHPVFIPEALYDRCVDLGMNMFGFVRGYPKLEISLSDTARVIQSGLHPNVQTLLKELR